MDSALENNIPADQSREGPSGVEGEIAPKKARTTEDFYLFCKYVLEHENYTNVHSEESLLCTEELDDEEIDEKPPMSELPIETKVASKFKRKSEEGPEIDYETDIKKAKSEPTKNGSSSSTAHGDVDTDNEDSYDLVTCFCEKPFANRPMIECSVCFTWIHLSCAKVRKSHIPEVYICPSCKEKRHS